MWRVFYAIYAIVMAILLVLSFFVGKPAGGMKAGILKLLIFVPVLVFAFIIGAVLILEFAWWKLLVFMVISVGLGHEMAHCMIYQDCSSETQYYARYQQIESLYAHLQGISGYADKLKSGNEALAEAFVRVRNNEEVSPMAKILVDTYYGKWKK